MTQQLHSWAVIPVEKKKQHVYTNTGMYMNVHSNFVYNTNKQNVSQMLEEGMATHSSILARKIPWTEEPGGLQSKGHEESDTIDMNAAPTPSDKNVTSAFIGKFCNPLIINYQEPI